VNPAPKDLPSVVKEIVSAILEGDWARYADESGEHFYYVIRASDHGVEVEEQRAFSNMLAFGKPDSGAFEDWYIRAALAEEPPDRFAKARKRVAAAGVNPQLLDEVLTASRSANSQAEICAVLDEWIPRFVTDRLDGLNAVLEAVRIDRVRQNQIFVSDSDRPEIREAMEARFLKELSDRFPKVIKRAVGFDWLSYRDPQVREAVHCYLYGFFRAAVLVASAALESRLKVFARTDFVYSYDILVDSVFGPAGAAGPDAAGASALKDLFKRRNLTAHEAAEPDQQEATRVIDLVRKTLDVLADRQMEST
jgi:hypothetical protein